MIVESPKVHAVVIAPRTPEPTAIDVANDRERMRYALIGSLALLAGMWAVWFAAWIFGWPLGDLGIRPRRVDGLIGILTAPLAHASFAHLMSNTLPMAILTTLTLYCYPRATRIALPFIWLASGLGVWLFARSSVHVGASGIANGLMFFLFVAGLLRRDRLAIVTALAVFFLYGGMVVSLLPTEPNISFEYHLAGAIAGVLSAVLLYRRDPAPPRKHYSWEAEPEEPSGDGEFELPHPRDVPVLWHRDEGPRSATVTTLRPDGNDGNHRIH